MAVTVNLNIFYPPVVPATGFYSRIIYDAQGTYWDEIAQTLLPFANVTSPDVPYLEGPAGTWTWTRIFDALPDGFYTVELYNIQGTKVGEYHIFLVGGVDACTAEVTKVPINENTGGTDALRYTNTGGQPIVGAVIRVYTNEDWQAQALANPVGTTFTNTTGRWLNPIFVASGSTYVIQFHLSRSYGPDTATVTV